MTTVTRPEHEFEVQDIMINMGPQHPATHGVFRMVLVVDGEIVRDVIPYIGYMHRGGEKLSETMDFRQGIGFMDRTEYLGQFNSELSYVMAVEKLMGLEVPERAQWIRMILCELNRLSSHFMFTGAFGTDIGVFGTAFTFSFREREVILDLFEEISGDRLMYAYFRPGGLAWEVTDNFEARVHEVLASSRQGIKDMDGLLTDNEIFKARTQGIGTMSAADAIDWGITGPVLRSTGVPMDLRRTEPYMFYDQLDFDVPVGQNGDVYDRWVLRIEEMRQSVRIVEQCMAKLKPGPILPERMPRMLRTPPGEVYLRTEAPRGEYGIYMVSKGGNRPYRLKVRSTGFANLQALRDMTIGSYVADAVVILGSLDIVLCEVDR